MRTITANAQAALSQNMGTEWLLILEVEWVDGGTILYSDQEVAGCQPRLLNMGGFDTSMILEGSGDSQELSVDLDDTDGSLREIYNAYDLHKRPASVYLLAKGTSLELDKILVFKGETVTPIEWGETQRSATFTVLSKLDSTQVGFSMEEGDFPNIPDEALGKAWPLVFGQVCHLPAVKVRAPRRGYLQGGVGIHDFTLEPRICQALKIQCPSQSTGNQNGLAQGPDNTWTTTIVKTNGPDLECVNRRYGEICVLRDLLEQQLAYEYDEFEVYNGTSFPQGERVTIFIDNATFDGTFNGNTFTVLSRQHPEFATFNHQACQNVKPLSYGLVNGVSQIGGLPTVQSLGQTGGYWQVSGGTRVGSQAITWIPESTGTHFTANQTQAQAFASCDEALKATPGMVGGPKESWALYDAMEASTFFWAPAGSEVYMETESEILYIVSLLPGTVDGVAAFRNAPNGFKYLTSVPTDYYTVYETDYQGYQVVEVGLDKALTLYDDTWEDDIYVSFTSSVGPNPCDIIEWLVNKYTGLTIDATTFAAVKSSLTNYPTNFYLTTRPDVYDLINDIAYQSRCSVYVRNDVLYIKYLSDEPTSVRTLTEADILSTTFVESLSETEDVYTTHNVTWKKAGAAVRGDQSVDRKLILKYNVNKYGTVEENWDYFCHNIYDLVLKTGTFWLIRKANSWKKLKFDLPLKHMALDVGDCVTINVAQFNDSGIKCIIESMNLDPDKNTISMVVWTPIRTGETSPYYWAWPAAQDCAAIWPLAGDTNGGGGYDFEVTPPIGHILLGGAHRDDQLVITTGDLHPSDVCDVLPLVRCELSDYLNFDEIEPDIQAKAIAQSAARSTMETSMSGGGGGNTEDEKQEGSCGVTGACGYRVEVQWHTSEGQGSYLNTHPGPGGPCGGPCPCSGGCPSCFGPQWGVCHTYGTAWAARAAAEYYKATYGPPEHDYWECNETRALWAVAKNGTHQGPFAADCEDIAASDSTQGEPGVVGVEINEPIGRTGNEPDAP
jgi:hypothetical protein